MLDLHLPIADVTISALIPLALGGGIGVLSGLLGVGGGFLLTPLLLLIGIPSTVAVATGAMPVRSMTSGVRYITSLAGPKVQLAIDAKDGNMWS